MENPTDFALKKEHKSFQSVGAELAEIDSLIDWKSVRIIFEFKYFNKRVSKAEHQLYNNYVKNSCFTAITWSLLF